MPSNKINALLGPFEEEEDPLKIGVVGLGDLGQSMAQGNQEARTHFAGHLNV